MPLPRTVRRSVPALALAFVALTGACSSSGSALQKVQTHKTIVIGTSGNNAPTIFRSPSAGLIGIDADWADIIAKKLGVKVQWKVVDFQGIVPGLQAQQFDAAMSGLRVTPERKKVIDFSDPIGYDEAAVVFPTGMTGITGPNDIKGRTVCVVAGSSNGELPVQRIGTAAKVTRYPGQAEAFADLKNRRCQVMVTGRILARYWIKSGQGAGFTLSQEGTDGTALAVGVPKGSGDLLKAINKAISDAKKGGAYDRIANKWLGESFRH
jgi:polar amino acid transport system substrate-binding protein